MGYAWETINHLEKNWKLLKLFKSKTNKETSAMVQRIVSEHLKSRGELKG